MFPDLTNPIIKNELIVNNGCRGIDTNLKNWPIVAIAAKGSDLSSVD